MQFHRNICSLASLRACCIDDNIVGGQDADDCEDVEDADDCDDADDCKDADDCEDVEDGEYCDDANYSDDVEEADVVDAGVDDVVGVSSDTFCVQYTSH